MEKLVLKANAKLNLTLDIVGVREDGYHLMDMVMQSVDLYDTVEITKGVGSFSVASSTAYIPTDKRNSAYKAAEALAKEVGCPMFDCKIHIEKHIPSQAGLGGGTADAAAVLVGLNRLYSLSLSDEQLMRLAPSVGADVPFCLKGGAARVMGIGEQVDSIKPLKRPRFVIVMPRRGSSTKKAFELFDQQGRDFSPDSEAMVKAVERDDTRAVARLCSNVFTPVVSSREMKELLSELVRLGALASSVTGSGSAIFGVFEDYAAALRCRDALRKKGFRSFTAAPAERGTETVRG